MYEELLDTVKSLMSASVVITILTFLIPGIPCSFANAYEFAAYRMQQYDFHGVQRGSRSASISGEVVVYDGQLGNVARKCVVARFQHVTAEFVRATANQYAACLMIVVPNRSPAELDASELRYFVDVEHELLDSESVALPVYVVYESPEVASLLDDAQTHDANGLSGAPSIMTVLWNSVVRTSSLASVSASVPRSLPDYAVPVVTAQYRAVPSASRTSLVDDDDGDTRRKAIVIVTHYDAFGLSPALAQGADSNGSGLVALLELARLLRPLFERVGTNSSANSAANAARNGFKTTRLTPANRLDRVELVFAAAGAGKLNFYGSKRFVEDELLAAKSDAAGAAGSIPKPARRAGSNVVDLTNLNVQLVLCLDTLAGSFAELMADEANMDSLKTTRDATVANEYDRLYVHVSKMPKRDSPIYRFVRLLEQVACEMRGEAHCNAAVTNDARSHASSRASEENEEEYDELAEKLETRSSDQSDMTTTPFVRVVHKKINLADDRFSWEHERYALKRVAAVTLSALPNGADARRFARRGSIFDTAAALDTGRLQRNVHIIAEAIARFVHNASVIDSDDANDYAKTGVNGDGTMLVDGSSMRNGYINALVRQLLTQPRSQQLVAPPSASGAPKAGTAIAGASTSVVQAIEHLFVRYANAAVRTVTFAVEKHDPEFVLYDGAAQVRISVHRAKSTVFDFSLLIVVSAYLAAVYLLVTRFETVTQYVAVSTRMLLTTSVHGTYSNGKHRVKAH